MKKLLLGLILVSFLFSQQAWRKMYKNQKVRSEADSTQFMGHTEFKGEVKFKPGWLEIDQMMPLTNDSLSSSLAWWNNPYGLGFFINQYVDTIRSFNTGEQVVLMDVDIIDGKITVDTVKVKGNADADTIWWHRDNTQWRLYSNDSSGLVFGITTNVIESSQGSAIIGGRNDTIKTNAHYSFIGGGWLNEIGTNADYGAILGGVNNTIAADECFIAGGDGHVVSGGSSAIVAGDRNECSGQYSFIGGGTNNDIVGSSSWAVAVVGGSENLITNAKGGTECSFIGGGKFNYISNTKNSGIAAGYYDSIYGGYDNFIGGGQKNVIRGESVDSCNVAFGNASVVDTCFASFAMNCWIKKADSTFGFTKQMWIIDGDTTKITGKDVTTSALVVDTIANKSDNLYFRADDTGKRLYFEDWYAIYFYDGVSHFADVTMQRAIIKQDYALEFGNQSNTELIHSTDQSLTTSGALLCGFSGQNYILFCDKAWIAKDFGHSDQTNPTIFIHSDVDPEAVENTQWISFAHDQTDGVIDVGKGGLKVNTDLTVSGDVYADTMWGELDTTGNNITTYVGNHAGGVTAEEVSDSCDVVRGEMQDSALVAVDDSLDLFLRKDGSVGLTGNWAAGDFDITGLEKVEADTLLGKIDTTEVDFTTYVSNHSGATSSEIGDSCDVVRSEIRDSVAVSTADSTTKIDTTYTPFQTYVGNHAGSMTRIAIIESLNVAEVGITEDWYFGDTIWSYSGADSFPAIYVDGGKLHIGPVGRTEIDSAQLGGGATLKKWVQVGSFMAFIENDDDTLYAIPDTTQLGGGGIVSSDKMTADSTISSTSGIETPLSFALTSGAYYTFTFNVSFETNNSAGGIMLALNYPAATMFSAQVMIQTGGDGTDGVTMGPLTSEADSLVVPNLVAANTPYWAIITGNIVPSSSGDIQLRFAAENTYTATIKQGSNAILYTLP